MLRVEIKAAEGIIGQIKILNIFFIIYLHINKIINKSSDYIKCQDSDNKCMVFIL